MVQSVGFTAVRVVAWVFLAAGVAVSFGYFLDQRLAHAGASLFAGFAFWAWSIAAVDFAEAALSALENTERYAREQAEALREATRGGD